MTAPKVNHSTALITPSYSADFERCRLLCESVDMFVDGGVDHFILVDDGDYAQFSQLDGNSRFVVNELDILPSWLHSIRQGFSPTSRKVDLWQGEELRLYRKPEAIATQHLPADDLHFSWTRSAAVLNGLEAPEFPAPDYINNLVSWQRKHILDMCENIENVTGRDWVSAIGRNRSFSECQIYGAYVDGVLNGEGHWRAPEGLCKTYWSGRALTREGVEAFVEEMSDDQVAIGVQSFTNTAPDVLRYLLSA